jgi:tetratricopeptide (TPR) repeat protein
MITATVRPWALALILVATPGLCDGAWGTQATQTARARVIGNVNEALAVSDSGKFAQARRNLQQSLTACPAGPAGRECRILYSSGLGSLLHRQAAVDRRNRDSLYLGAVAYYERILKEAPDNSEAIYGKALSYRALGPQEWMEPFFKQAPSLDAGRSALYYTFLGDYYAAGQRWPNAVEAYKRAVQQDAGEEGARSGLIAALAAQGPQTSRELLQYARDWQARYPGSAADAYRAALRSSFSQGPGDAAADVAVVGLVRTQARNGLTLGEVPPGVSTDWTPVRELRAFLSESRPEAAPWWMQGQERREGLAQAALAAGRDAASEGKYERAELIWTQALKLVYPPAVVLLDLNRELALLYFRQPRLDPDQRKFDALEQRLFESKGEALAGGDTEAAQRYHTTLGLIYVERGQWEGQIFAHGARQQLTWALDKADQHRRPSFYQPLPELRLLLAHGLDSLRRPGAARRYAEAAMAFLDTDDFGAADSAARKATRLDWDATAPTQVLVLRSQLARGGRAAVEACTTERIATIGRVGNAEYAVRQRLAEFLARQRFKILADCVKAGPSNRRREKAIAAFRLADSAVTLVGGGDLVRFERVMTTLLDPFGVSFEAAHLDPAPPWGDQYIQVSLPGETRPLQVAAALDDVIAARVVAELGSSVKPFPIAVSAGVLTVPATPGVAPPVLQRLKKVTGVREVRARKTSP